MTLYCEFCKRPLSDIGYLTFQNKRFCKNECVTKYIKGEKSEEDFLFAVVEEQMKLNSHPRLNWKPLIGMSLTKAVAKFKAAGLNAEQTFKTLIYEHPEFSEETKRRMKIGVCARFGEMATAQNDIL